MSTDVTTDDAATEPVFEKGLKRGRRKLVDDAARRRHAGLSAIAAFGLGIFAFLYAGDAHAPHGMMQVAMLFGPIGILCTFGFFATFGKDDE